MIRGYWHIYATDNGCRIAREQLGRLQGSGLLAATQSLTVGVLGDGDPGLDLPGAVIYRSGNAEEYEDWTLRRIHEDARQDDFDCWYIHTKGASHPGTDADAWRNTMEACVIDQWAWCLRQLQDVGSCGPLLAFNPQPFYAGNFWWSKARHVRTLLSPEELLRERLSQGLAPELRRFIAEEWITQGNLGQTRDEQLAALRPFSFWHIC